MKKLCIAALVASAFAPIAFATPAAAAPVDGSICGFTDRQIAMGFYCDQSVEVENISRVIGNGSRCQDATITTTVTTAYNKNGHVMDSRTVVSEPVESDWGSSYPIGGGCNY